ncbi:OmpH family outer membrane protein [Singulisphaera sp. PoT]|uniref:OmpH family outer membrane protein n=1 Tax=Singulisphaera sp. PoT TaxID=3411797 RepID=UPI003BF491BA
MAKVIFNGDAGDVYTNETGKILYQLIVSFSNSCGVCIQYAYAIGSFWPIPFHRGCRCENRPIMPGEAAHPFVDFMEEIRQLSPRQQSVAVGKANWQLIESGVVGWEEVVTKARVRSLREVVSRNKLSVEQMTKAGVPKYRADEAHAAVNTPAHQIVDQQRKQLVENLMGMGITKDQIREAFGGRVADRVTIGAGPSGKGYMPVDPKTPKPPQGPTQGGTGGAKPPSPKPTPKPAPPVPKATKPQPPVPIMPGQPIEERIKGYAEGDAKLEKIAKVGDEIEKLRQSYQDENDDLNKRMIPLLEAREKLDRKTRGKPKGQDLEERQRIELEIQKLKEERALIRSKIDGIEEVARQKVLDIIRVANPINLSCPEVSSFSPGGSQKDPLSAETRENLKAAVDWYQAAFAKGQELKMSIPVAQIPSNEEQRAYHSSGYVALSFRCPSRTAVHEIAHALDTEYKQGADDICVRTQEFLKHRVGDEKPQKLKDLFPGSRYGDDEEGRKDRFDEAFGEGSSAWYVGKPYGRRSSEVLSMGMEYFYADPVDFAKKDPEYCKFILGILDGSLR